MIEQPRRSPSLDRGMLSAALVASIKSMGNSRNGPWRRNGVWMPRLAGGNPAARSTCQGWLSGDHLHGSHSRAPSIKHSHALPSRKFGRYVMSSPRLRVRTDTQRFRRAMVHDSRGMSVHQILANQYDPADMRGAYQERLRLGSRLSVPTTYPIQANQPWDDGRMAPASSKATAAQVRKARKNMPATFTD